jgi:hypothetical protein
MPTTWDALAAAWSGARDVFKTDRAKTGDPAAVAKQIGVPALPPSYLAFVRRF